MSSWKLIYCFTKRLSQSEENFKNILYSLRKSIELSSRFHDVKIFTDKETIQYLNNIEVKKELLDFGHLRFLDDIKISVLPHIKENEVLIDPDVFLFKKLYITEKCDIFVERPENIKDNWYVTDYEYSKKFKFSKNIKLESISGNVTNIGILKFFNTHLLNKYIERYNFVRNIALEEETTLDEFPKYSILLGQLLLQNVIDENGYIVSYAKHNKKNEYYHLAGEQKYENDYLNKILERKNNQSII